MLYEVITLVANSYPDSNRGLVGANIICYIVITSYSIHYTKLYEPNNLIVFYRFAVDRPADVQGEEAQVLENIFFLGGG